MPNLLPTIEGGGKYYAYYIIIKYNNTTHSRVSVHVSMSRRILLCNNISGDF